MLKKATKFIQNLTSPNADSRQEEEEDPGIPRVYSEQYFYGRITRQESEDILAINGMEDGLYLLRESITPMGNFSLTMAHKGSAVHYSIEKKIDGKYMIADGMAFSDPVALIQHYQTSQNGFVTVPKTPCCRQFGQEAVAFRGLSYRELHSHMRAEARKMNANMSRALGPMRDSFLMHVLRTMHEQMPWYHGEITRDECVRRLEESGHEDGKFIIRKRADNQTFALTMSCDGMMRHYFILVNDGETYSIENGQRFKALVILVDHYHNKRDGLPCKLTFPCMAPNVKHQVVENYIKLHKNLTDQRGVVGRVQPDRPPNIPPPRPPSFPSFSSFPSFLPSNGDSGGSLQREHSHRLVSEDEPVDLEESVHSPLGPALSYEEAQELENDYIDIRSDVMSTDLTPEQIELEGKLGAGQFGEVRKGKCKLHRKIVPVAVKTLKNNNPAGEKEILGEANVMKRLDHPHIVRMIGVCKGESLMLVMELAELGPLKKYLERHLEMKAWHQLEMMVQICDGMTYLESNDVVHRDLATRNVLLVSDHFAKISDFGMSRVIDRGDYYLAHGPGRWPLMWYAPECVNFHKFDSKSDVWSFGVTIWEIMSFGARPYDKKKPVEILNYIEAGNRLRKPKNCDDRIYDIMLSCWAKRKEDRPQFKQLMPTLEQLCREFRQRDP